MKPDLTAPPLKFSGQTVLLAGSFNHRTEPAVKDAIRVEGGLITYLMLPTVDAIIVSSECKGVVAQVKEAERLNKKGAHIKVIGEADLYGFCVASSSEAALLLQCGQADRLSTHLKNYHRSLDLSHADISGADLGGFSFRSIKIDGCNFSNTKLTRTVFADCHNINFSGAKIHGAVFESLDGCRFDGASLEKLFWGYSNRLNPMESPVINACSFVDAKFSQVILNNRVRTSNFTNASFSRSLVSNCEFEDCDFSTAHYAFCDFVNVGFLNNKLVGTKFVTSTMVGTRFSNSDLSNATFEHSNLAFSDLVNAHIQKTNFVKCNLSDANFAPEKQAEIAAQSNSSTSGAQAGQHTMELEKIVKEAHSVEINFNARNGNVVATLQIESGTSGVAGASDKFVINTKFFRTMHIEDPRVVDLKRFGVRKIIAEKLPDAIVYVSKLCSGFTPDLYGLDCKIVKGPIDAGAFKPFVVRAISEAFGLPILSTDDFNEALREHSAKQDEFKAELVKMFRGGAAGIAKLNLLSERARSSLTLDQVDLSNCDLPAVNLSHMDMSTVNLNGAQLIKSTLDLANFSNATLIGCKLDDASCKNVVAEHSDFSKSSVVQADFQGANLKNASFVDADLTDAKFEDADIRGAIFEGAKVEGIVFGGTRYDENTKFPAGFAASTGLVWDSRYAKDREKVAEVETEPPELQDFTEFLGRLEANLETSRFKNALKMLKAESFQLFSSITPKAVTGIVKSQSSEELIYACSLSAKGDFFCGTQNLRPCGGLRGALCKHLLVLIVGLAKAGELDINKADKWIRLSRTGYSNLDKEVVTLLFLRFSAGEIDWRPTETVPEDYYTF
jgi:uncharacterized protein YjbI with pentapeptide repeats